MGYDSLYKFTEPGMDLYQKVFMNMCQEVTLDIFDPYLVSKVDGTRPFTPVQYNTAKEMARAVLGSIGGMSLSDLLPQAGLWAWLTFILRDQLFKCDARGKRKVGEIHRWYPSDPNDWQKGQRHLLRMPVQLLYSLGDDADHLLCGHPSVLPEIREQLTSQQDMFNQTFQHVARNLYYDVTSGKLKRGAGGKGGGSPRRLAKVRQQLDVTWDFEDLDCEKIIKMLPREFERFKQHESIPKQPMAD